MSADHLKSFDLVGKKEEVSDFISMITPSDTPFLSSIKSESIGNTLYQWQEDVLRGAAKNAKVEGADATDSNRGQPTMRSNGTQILGETFKLSGTSQVIKTYGRKGAVAYETMKTGKVIKVDLEHSLVGTGQTYVAHSEVTGPPVVGTAGEFAGVQAQIHADVTNDAGGGADRALSETIIVATHEDLYNEGSDASILMVKPSDTKIIAGFSQTSGRTHMVENGEKKLTQVINIYESPFGTVRVVKNRHIRAGDALMYSPERWKLMTLRNWFREKLAKVGDADRWMIVGEFGLKHVNQKASALITDLT